MTGKGLGSASLQGIFVAAASGALLGLFVHRSAVGALYTTHPSVLDTHWLGLSVAVSALLTVCIWLALVRKRSGLSLAANSDEHANRPSVDGKYPSLWFLIGLSPLLATFLRPAGDVLWSGGLLVISGLAVAWATVCGGQGSRGGSLRRLPLATSPPVVGLLAAGLALSVYWRTLAPSIVVGDSSEMQVIAHTLGIAHPTGYPLYSLLGKLFTWLPLGNIAFRVNLMSAVFAAATASLLAICLSRLTGNALAALAAALALAFSPTLWSQAVVAEVYALQAFIVMAVLAAVLIRDRGDAATPMATGGCTRAASTSGWPLVGLLFGMGLAHHRMTVLLAPALIIALLTDGRRVALRPGVLALTTLAALVPLGLYAYLPLRWPAVNGLPLTLDEFVWYVTGSGYSSALRWEALLEAPDRYAMFLRLAAQQFSLVGLSLAAVGVLWSAWRLRRVLLVSGCIFGANTAFGIAYYVPDVEVFFIPSHVVLALWIGLGIAGIIDVGRGVSRNTPDRQRCAPTGGTARGTACGIAPLFLVLPLFLLTSNWTTVDRSQEWAAHEWGERVLRYPIEPGALIVADVDRLSPLRYIFGVEWPGQGVTAIMPDTEEQCLAIIEHSMRSGRPTYLARFLPDIGKKYSLTSPGPLIQLRQKEAPVSAAVEKPARVLDWQCLPGLSLIGAEGRGPTGEDERNDMQWEVERGDTLSFTLWWRSEQPLSYDARTRFALVSDVGRVWHTTPWRSAVQGMYPTWLWRSGEIVADYYELVIPGDIPPQPYSVVLEVAGHGSNAPSRQLARLVLSDSAGRLDRRGLTSALAAHGDQLAVTGVSLESPVAAGGITQVRLAWRVADAMPEDYELRWTLVDQTGAMAAQGKSPLFGGEWPTHKWRNQQDYVTKVPIPVPREIAPGWYEVRIALESGDGRVAQVRQGWPIQRLDYHSVGTLQVIKGDGPLTNFDNKAILLRCELPRQSVKAGETLPILLEWQCVSPMPRDYTVFVHLLGPDGRVKAQIDRYPVYGTRPTSQWKQGEKLEDRYELALPADLSDGLYEVEVGLYLAATMERVPVVDEGLRPISDHVILGRLSIGQ
ncbi:MAG: glycosyltransferase family 117 protein [Chloroflexota bacterium]